MNLNNEGSQSHINLGDKTITKGEIYFRMVRCLYKKYVIRKDKEYSEKEFSNSLRSVGKLALDTLVSQNPLLQRKEVIGKVGQHFLVSLNLEALEVLAHKIRPRMEKLMMIEMMPWFEDSDKSMEQHFIDLTLKTEDTSTRKLLDHYRDLFVQDSNHINQINKILLKGDPGIGKSTLSRKITFDWAKGSLSAFAIVFLISPRFTQNGTSIENIVINQYSFLEQLEIKEGKLKAIFEIFGAHCLLIFDGFDPTSIANNRDVQKITEGHKLPQCNVLVTSRTHSARQIKKFFNKIVTVEGFAPDMAAKFAGRILSDSQAITNVLNFKPLEFRAEQKLITSPILLSILCVLSAKGEIDVLCKTMSMGEIYTRMVRCLYKTYTVQKELDYEDKNFLKFLNVLGGLAFNMLKTNKHLFRKKEILKQTDEKLFDYGIICGCEDHQRLMSDETADIHVTFIHSSFEELFYSGPL